MHIQNVNMKRLLTHGVIERIIIFLASMLLLYLIVSMYFNYHFLFQTTINGVDVSLKAYDDAELKIRDFMKDYKVQLVERDGEREYITGEEIDIQYNDNLDISEIYRKQNSFHWINSLFKSHKYEQKGLYKFDKDKLMDKINQLKCMNMAMTEPRNVDFQYSCGSYQVVKEVYGNKINKSKVYAVIKKSIGAGKTKIDLNKQNCYVNPKYTLKSKKTAKTRGILNKMVSTYIVYEFGNTEEILDGDMISRWLSVNDNLDVKLSKTAVSNYVKGLSSKYDTVGTARIFKTSLGNEVEVEGGIYGWKINKVAETNALIRNIKFGDSMEKEPIYSQKAYSREDEIGKTYVEINITKQRLWFYKDGELIAQGSVVTGNPNRGNATAVGYYMINYKQKNATLEGPGYKVIVTYWMPFYGNMGLHDAKWRSSFGGEIYKRNGTHGCVNAPLFLAKRIFDTIDVGTPVISYTE